MRFTLPEFLLMPEQMLDPKSQGLGLENGVRGTAPARFIITPPVPVS